MKLLLDTHAFLWFISGRENLPVKIKDLIEDAHEETFLSIASVWEMAIKSGLGKLKFERPMDELIPQQIQINHIQTLPIEMEHILRLTQLHDHHRDPFDRLIIAQALYEDMPIASMDQTFDSYGVRRIWE